MELRYTMLPQIREDLSYYMRSKLMRRYGAKATTFGIAIYDNCYQNGAIISSKQLQYWSVL